MIPTETWVLPRPRKDAYVGSFPLHFEQRLWRLMGKPAKVLHPFGGLAEIGDWVDGTIETILRGDKSLETAAPRPSVAQVTQPDKGGCNA